MTRKYTLSKAGKPLNCFTMKRRLASSGLLLLLFSVLFLNGCSSKKPANNGPEKPDSNDELVVVATTDFHAELDKAEGMASILRDLKSRYGDRMLYLDGGDLFQGSLEGNMSKGKSVVEFYNQLPIDAAAIGNHEFDFGPDVPNRIQVKPGEDGMGNLKARVKEAKFPWLSSNIVLSPLISCMPAGKQCNALGQKTVFEPRTIIERAGKKIGIIGGTTTETPDITDRDFIAGTEFEPLGPIVAAEAKYLREKEHCDYVLLVAHEGLHLDSKGKYMPGFGIAAVVESLPVHSLDAVIAGHIHVKAQAVINGIPVMQEGRSAWVVGILQLSGKGKSERFRMESFVEIPAKAEQPDITDLLAPYREAAEKYKRMIVGNASGTFKVDPKSESALGNLVADAVLVAGSKEYGAQFALMNAGGCRNDLPDGEITYEEIYAVMPFSNSLVVAELTGAQLRTLLEISTSGDPGMPGVSGLRLKVLDVPPGVPGSWDRDLNGDGKKETWERNLLVYVRDEHGNELKPNAIYKVATNSYLSGGGDYQKFVYDKVPKKKIHDFPGLLIRDAIVNYLKQHPDVKPEDYYSPTKKRIELTKPPIENKSNNQKQGIGYNAVPNSYKFVVHVIARADTPGLANHSFRGFAAEELPLPPDR
jgi:5'-nucleotidase